MKTTRIALLLAATLLFITTATALAGVDPTPFRVTDARLDVVATKITGILTMIDAVMGVDPEPFCPTPESLMAKEVKNLAKQMQRSEDETEKVLGYTPPDPCIEGCVYTDEEIALIALKIAHERSLTMRVIDQADRYLIVLGDDPEPFKKVLKAFEKLKRNATSLVDAIDDYYPPAR